MCDLVSKEGKRPPHVPLSCVIMCVVCVVCGWPCKGLGGVRLHRVPYICLEVAAAYASAVASQRAVQACVAAQLCADRIQRWVSGYREGVSALASAVAAERAVQACVAAQNCADRARLAVARIRSRARALERTWLTAARLRARRD